MLSDPIKRQSHDLSVLNQKKKQRLPQYGQTIRHGSRGYAEPLIPEPQAPVDLDTASLTRFLHSYRPSFDQLFDRIFSNFTPSARPKGERLENLNVVITLTSEQAFRGGQVKISLPAEPTCPSCSGRGWIGPYECWRCSGEGVISGKYPIMINYPSGISENHMIKMPLDYYGINNLYLTVHFRISELL